MDLDLYLPAKWRADFDLQVKSVVVNFFALKVPGGLGLVGGLGAGAGGAAGAAEEED